MTTFGYALSFCLTSERCSFNRERTAVKRTGDFATGSYPEDTETVYTHYLPPQHQHLSTPPCQRSHFPGHGHAPARFRQSALEAPPCTARAGPNLLAWCTGSAATRPARAGTAARYPVRGTPAASPRLARCCLWCPPS